MPRLYDFKCNRCGYVFEHLFISGEKITPVLRCPKCPIGVAEKQLPVVRCNMGAAGAYGYYDDNLETYIHSNAHRCHVMAEKGVCDYYESPKPEKLTDKHLAPKKGQWE